MELTQDHVGTPGHISKSGGSACAESAVDNAIYSALRFEASLDRAIQTAVNLDGDSDTVAAVTGNIRGAWNGIGCIDQKWIGPLHPDQYLKAL